VWRWCAARWSHFCFLLSACSHAGLVDEGMHCYASMSQFTWFVQNWNIARAWLIFLAMLAILRWWIRSSKCLVKHMRLCIRHCQALAEFMVMCRWEKVLLNEQLFSGEFHCGHVCKVGE
jgi:hypothetical protein